MGDEIVYQTKKPVWVVCFVLVCVQVIPSVSAFYLNFKSEDGMNVVAKGQISLDAIEITSGHSSVDQSDKRELLRKLDDLKTQIEARVSNADSELKQIKMIEAETRKLIGATTSWDDAEPHNKLTASAEETQVLNQDSPKEQILLEQIKKMTEEIDLGEIIQQANSNDESDGLSNSDDTIERILEDIFSQTEQIPTTTELAEKIDPKILIKEAIRNDDEIKTAELIKKFYNVDGERAFRPISIAAETCSVKVAEMLLQNGADVNVIGGTGWRPIHVAIYTDCRPIAKMLIDHGADLSATIHLGYTALRITTQNKRKNVIDLLEEAVEGMRTGCSTEDSSECTTTEDSTAEELEHDAWVKQWQSGKEKEFVLEALIRDASDDEIKAAELFSKIYGQDVNGDENYRPLSAAVRSCSVIVTEMLIHDGTRFASGDGWSTLHFPNWASSEDCAPIVKMLAKHGAHLSSRIGSGYTALSIARLMGRESIIDLFERMRIGYILECTTTEASATDELVVRKLIQQAVSNDDVVEMELLINKYYERDVNGDKDFIPISSAAESCKVKVAEMLIQKGANVNIVGEGGWSPIHVATYADCAPIVKMLIEHGADLSAKTALGYTALYIATHDERENVIVLPKKPLEGMRTRCSPEMTEDSPGDELEELDASEDQSQSSEEQDTEENPWYTDLDSQTEQTDTTTEPEKINKKKLIQQAVWNDDVVEMELLINKYYERDVNGDKDFIPISSAAESCKVKVAEMLIQKGANVNIVGGGGWSPIHVATYADCRPIVTMLIEHGADLSATTDLGYTALNLANQHQRENVIDLLKKPLEGMGTRCSTEDSSECTATEDSPGDELEELDASEDQSQSSEEQDTEENPWYTDLDSQTEQTDTITESEKINKKKLIQQAVWNDDVVEMELLINKYYERDVNGDKDFIPISSAAESCKVKVAKMLIQKGANVNIVGGGGWSPIHVATYADCLPIVEMLIEHGADSSAKTGLGYTALDIATQDKRENVIDLLEKLWWSRFKFNHSLPTN